MSLISYIYYLHLDAFEFYNMPTIACNKVLTSDSFVCSLKEVTSLTHIHSSAEVSSLPNWVSSVFSGILFANISSSSEEVLFSVPFDNFCQMFFFI